MSVRSFEEFLFSALLSDTMQSFTDVSGAMAIDLLLDEMRMREKYGNDYSQALKVFHTDIVDAVSPTDTKVNIDLAVNFVDKENKIIYMDINMYTTEMDFFERVDGTYNNIINIMANKNTTLYETVITQEEARANVSKLKVELYYFV